MIWTRGGEKTVMVYTHVLNGYGRGVRGPADSLGTVLG